MWIGGPSVGRRIRSDESHVLNAGCITEREREIRCVSECVVSSVNSDGRATASSARLLSFVSRASPVYAVRVRLPFHILCRNSTQTNDVCS